MLFALIEAIRLVAANAAEDLDATLDALAAQATRLFAADEALVHLVVPGTNEMVNGQLSPILAYADILAARLCGQDGAMAQEIADAAERAAETIGRLQHIVRFEETATPLGPMLDLEQAAAV
jgi:hypothetical protein